MSLFHYTTTSGAFAILDSQCLFATHYRYLNDRSELQAFRDLIEPRFNAVAEKHCEDLMSKGAYSGVEVEATLQVVKSWFNQWEEGVNEIIPVYITSFCSHEDNSPESRQGLLSQWRAYGAGGGCAIVFDIDGVGSLIEEEIKGNAYGQLRLSPVKYLNGPVLFRDLDLEEAVIAICNGLLEDTEQSRQSRREAIGKLTKVLAELAPTLKHAAFHEERELRIIAAATRKAKIRSGETRAAKRVDIRFRDGKPAPYIKLFEGSILPILRILVGPQPDQQFVAAALQMAVESKGLSVPIECSSIPLVL